MADDEVCKQTQLECLDTLPLTSILDKYINRKANITISDGTEKTGWIYTVDPVTHSVVLLLKSENGTSPFHLCILCGHAVKNVDLLEDILSEQELESIEDLMHGLKRPSYYSHCELNTRKIQLKEWLEKNRITVEEVGVECEVLSVMGVLFVDPPYDANCCRSSNEIILDRIQKLIGAKPDQG